MMLFVDGYLLQDALVLVCTPGCPHVNEQRKDDNGNRKGLGPTYWERPQLSLRDIPNTQAIAKQTKNYYYYTYPINTTSQTDQHQYV